MIDSREILFRQHFRMYGDCIWSYRTPLRKVSDWQVLVLGLDLYVLFNHLLQASAQTQVVTFCAVQKATTKVNEAFKPDTKLKA